MTFPALSLVRILPLAAGVAGPAFLLAAPGAGSLYSLGAAGISVLAAVALFVLPAPPRSEIGAGDPDPWAGNPIAAEPQRGNGSGSRESRLYAEQEFLERRERIGTAGSGTTLLIALQPLDPVGNTVPADNTGDVRELVAAAIRSAVRADDLVGVLDDGTFVVFLRQAPQSLSEFIGQRICSQIEDTIFLDGALKLLALSASVGGVTAAPASVDRELDVARTNLAGAVLQGPGAVQISMVA